jgi:FMN-dependent NADH-azoreductase
VFGFFGVNDVIFIQAEGVNIGREQGAKSIEAARAEISRHESRTTKAELT